MPEKDERGLVRRMLPTLRSGTGVRIELLLVALAVVVAVALFPTLRDLERRLLVELSEMGSLAPVALVAGYSLAAASLLPAVPLDLAAGAHFGFLEGVLWVQVAASLASVTGYQLGRLVLRRPVLRLLRSRPRLGRIEEAVAREGWRIVFLTRLSPVFSFSLLNVLYGAARVRFWPYLFSSCAGMIPGTALYVYAGVMAGDLSGAPGRPVRSGGDWTVSILGFALTAALVVYITLRAQRSLTKRLDDDRPEDGAACRLPSG